MAEANEVEVSFNSRLKRARARFKLSLCLESRWPPAEFMEKTREKLEDQLEDGHIEYFELFEKRLQRLWSYIRENADTLNLERVIKVTLGQGARQLEEIAITPSQSPPAIAAITSSLPERKLKSVHFTAFMFHVIKGLQKIGIKDKPDGSQLRFIFLLMKNGQEIRQWPVHAQPKAEDHPKQGFWVEFNPSHRYATLHIFDSAYLKNEVSRKDLWTKAETALHELNTSKLRLTILESHTLDKLHSLSHKAQALGFGLPYSLLIAYDESYRLESVVVDPQMQVVSPEAADLPRWKVRIGALTQQNRSRFLDIEVDQQGMQARLRRVDFDAIDRIKDQLTIDWLVGEFGKCQIRFGYDKYVGSVLEILKSGKSPVGMRIAEGKLPRLGRKAYFFPIPPEFSTLDASPERVRDRQNIRLARAQQLIGEVRFHDGTPGTDVFGEEVHGRGSSAEAKLTAGPGIRLQEPGRFYATRDGLVDVKGGVVSCLESHIHEGNVNLSSGNMAFEGNLIIRGDIESGARVEVKGTLLVEGHVGPSQVRVRGDLEVKGGIVTGEQGLVRVGGNLRASFSENSRLIVAGDVRFKTSLLNCQLIAGGSVSFEEPSQSLISGGELSCWQSIQVARLGLHQGQRTICRLGTHFILEQRWQRLKRRMAAVASIQQSLLKQAQETHPNASLPTKKAAWESRQNLIAVRLKKAERVAKKLQSTIQGLERTLTFNASATLQVTRELETQVTIFAGNKSIPLSQRLKSVFVSVSPFRGGHLHDLDSWPDFQSQVLGIHGQTA